MTTVNESKVKERFRNQSFAIFEGCNHLAVRTRPVMSFSFRYLCLCLCVDARYYFFKKKKIVHTALDL